MKLFILLIISILFISSAVAESESFAFGTNVKITKIITTGLNETGEDNNQEKKVFTRHLIDKLGSSPSSVLSETPLPPVPKNSVVNNQNQGNPSEEQDDEDKLGFFSFIFLIVLSVAVLAGYLYYKNQSYIDTGGDYEEYPPLPQSDDSVIPEQIDDSRGFNEFDF